ncbi:restriction endonuclease subunit S [Mediterraneibacter sp. NSJ-55]|uniref:Restriction endonuclease subunit S n=1 Tax=Mediterraneibacter hominis TaxID=2763054 RepID=A0A923LG63_9FIRM|nr:restriction endonuclease subunit S [Mediterraneibacter hominis]MBC5687474.1 restriction endonuclease subunit S [Mediterraneibacter hominis]
MAKGKKKENLTPEERLQAALVPDSEQPYKVPENWCWVTLDSINQYQSSSIDPSKHPNDFFELYSVPSSADDYPEITMGSEIGSTKQRVEKGDVLLCKINPRINRVWKVSQYTENALLASSEWIIIRNPQIYSDYLMYCFRTPYFREYMLSNVSGVGGSLMRAQPKYVKTYPLPLPPLPEQQRIVDRIESLFAKLDEAKQKAQYALDSFETRKAAILHKAFTGKLTALWRKEHGVGMESWEETSLGKYIDSQYGYTESASQEQIGPKFLRITDIQNGIVNWNDVPFCKISDSDFDRYAVSKNDIMIARTGATTGKSYLIVDDVEAVFASYLIRIKIKSAKLSPQYLYCFLQSQMYWSQITEFSAGIAQPGINAKKLKEIILPIPAVPEQTEIVRILDDLLAKEQQAKESAEAVLKQIDLIKKSILARAFRGELGTNDPAEESSIELLKRSFLETIEIEKVKPKQVTNQKAKVIFMRKTIMEALSKGMSLTPENLKSETGLPIDDFYAQLKELINNGSVVESRENGESYLEAANENR